MKRLICMFLCIAMVLSLTACGQPQEATGAPQTAVTGAAETVDPLEAVLAVARELLDAGDLAGAADALAGADSADARVTELLAEIESLRFIDLDVTTELIYHTGDPETLVVHGMTAREFSDGTVRFTFDFTAPEGTPLKVLGSYLEYLDHTPATGEREQFVFEIAAADIRRIGSKFAIEFGPGSVSMLTVDVTVAWPGEGTAGVSDLPLLSDGQPMGETVELTFEAPEGVTVQSFTRQWLDNQCYRYTLDMSAPQGQTVTVTNADGLVYHEPVPADGPIAFDLPWSVASVYPEILVNFPDSPEYSFTAYNGYLLTGETPVSESRPLDYSETTDYDNTYGRMEILSATAWDLSHDFVRYEVVFSTQEVVCADAYYHEAVTDEVIPRFSMKTAAVFPSGQQTLTFDLRKEDAAGAGHPVVLFKN